MTMGGDRGGDRGGPGWLLSAARSAGFGFGCTGVFPVGLAIMISRIDPAVEAAMHRHPRLLRLRLPRISGGPAKRQR
jgi:hypothetical protein